MSRYIVQPILGFNGSPYYVVWDTATNKGLEGYGCDTWAQHAADDLNRQHRGEASTCTNAFTAAAEA